MWDAACRLGVDVFLLSAGTPCTDLSAANKHRQGLEKGKRSNLFFVAVEI